MSTYEDDQRRAARAIYAPDEFIPLAEAARIAFPAGGVKVSSLRLEASRGRLTVYRIAGKVMTTLADVRRMADLCRVEPSLPVSGSDQPEMIRTPSEQSLRADVETARAALRLRLDRRKQGLAIEPARGTGPKPRAKTNSKTL